MARREVLVIEDDIDGSEGAETVAFGLDGVSYEIDLNSKHAAALRKVMQPYLNAARKIPGAKKKPQSRSRKRGDNAQIREWARDAGYEDVPNRGRIPARIRQDYEEAVKAGYAA